MTITEYLIQLEDELKYLPLKKRKAIINQYQYKINVDLDLGISEEDITKKLESPDKVARDIYESNGIDYLERRKRAKKGTDILVMIASIIGSLLTISAGFVLTIYLGYSIYRLVYLLVLLGDALEIILMSLFVIPLILFLLLVFIYLVDILILLFSFLLEKIMYALDKEAPIKDFSLVELIESKIKKPKIFRKTLIGISIAFIFFGFVNFFMHTYLYRSFIKATPTRYTTTFTEEVTEYLDFSFDEAKVSFIKGDTFSIMITSEFKKEITKTIDGTVTKISSSELHYFDFLDFLKEPLPVIQISVPDNYNIYYAQKTGLLEAKDLVVKNFHFQLDSGNLIIQGLQTDDATIIVGSAGVTLENTKTKNFDFKIGSGEAKLTNLESLDATIKNDNAKVTITNLAANSVDLVISTGSCNLKDTTIDTIKCNMTDGVFDIYNVNSSDVSITSTSSSNISFGMTKINKLSSVTMGGGLVAYETEIDDAHIETAGSVLFEKIRGNYNIKCIGSRAQISEVKAGNFILSTDRTDTELEYIKADYIEYQGNRSTTTLYFLFGKEMKISDVKNDLHLDNDKSISLYDEVKYNEYYQKINNLAISGGATYRVEEGTEISYLE